MRRSSSFFWLIVEQIAPSDIPKSSLLAHWIGGLDSLDGEALDCYFSVMKSDPGEIYQSGKLMRFLPKKRASTDQAPGPSIASPAPNIALTGLRRTGHTARSRVSHCAYR